MRPVRKISVLLLSGCLLLGACSVPLEHIPPPVAKAILPAGFILPYGAMYSMTVDAMSKVFHANKAQYNTGTIETPWYNYKYTSSPIGITQYRYRILAYVIQYKQGYGVHVRVPVEKLSRQGWTYDTRDSTLERSVYQQLVSWAAQRNSQAPRIWGPKYKYNKLP